MKQIDWREAPEWAMKHGIVGAYRENQIWFNDTQYTYCDGQQGGRTILFTGGCVYKPNEIYAITERPTTPQWNGEGLPPVGVECEYQRNDVIYKQAWVAVTPRYIGEPVTVLKHSASGNEFTEMTDSCIFRPIRTPEQIAAEEREAAIEEMKRVWMEDGFKGGGFAALYDAGYKKPNA